MNLYPSSPLNELCPGFNVIDTFAGSEAAAGPVSQLDATLALTEEPLFSISVPRSTLTLSLLGLMASILSDLWNVAPPIFT